MIDVGMTIAIVLSFRNTTPAASQKFETEQTQLGDIVDDKIRLIYFV